MIIKYRWNNSELVFLCTCRSFFFFYQNDSTVNGIAAFHYVIPAIEMKNGSMDPGFFPNGPSGVYNLSAVEQFGESLGEGAGKKLRDESEKEGE